ncbi:MAG: SDR family oxidoreductase [Hydrogenophilus sp.]|nr:SDR family oxidoreductase [Hydrogenophilus sp.]
MEQWVVITGANRGIGLALTRRYAGRGERVIAFCRAASPELKEIAGVEVVEGMDVAAEDAPERFAGALAGRRVGVMVHNAGVFAETPLGAVTAETLLTLYRVNAMAPLLLTQAALASLPPGSKVALVTSRMGSIEDNGSGGYYAYRMSKAALNAAGKSLAIDLRPRGVAVAILHPGFVRTRMVGFAGDITPEESAAGLVARIDALTLETSGSFWHQNGSVLPW